MVGEDKDNWQEKMLTIFWDWIIDALGVFLVIGGRFWVF